MGCGRRRRRGRENCRVRARVNPDLKVVGAGNIEVAPVTLAGNDIEQTAVESGPGSQKASQLSNNRDL
ncbi:hypothetical protein GXN76_12320 [Kroppenstedtia pulmonis]|uniref:Uncharacterized protein n=1 Tax=Kroppenstedtia pulmonis TaxID=1380685 RepID=A0A7D4CP23_9BACL|nr:hypothetical protein [Kroppenstedtia pulmonis]QKG85178.1 hypothetical protein GXN76_12320 [Kroppenstedtia pulmonis]